VFTVTEREDMRTELLAFAQADERISAAAITGSAARGTQDAWSDVDLAFGVAPGVSQEDVLAAWTEMMYRNHAAVHHFDVVVGAWVYRVFLLPSTLQVDLAFVPAAQFGARAPSFGLVFGTSVELPARQPPEATDLVGMGWLYALHVHRCVERGRLWQAELMLSGLRGEVLKLACLRHGLPTAEGRGFDGLPEDVTRPLEPALVASLQADEVRRAFEVAMAAFVAEARLVDGQLAGRIEPTLRQLLVG
jgi:predicted nucleotidyltransferase